jgi:transcriptional regulator with XRE-family HTH domain
MNLGHNVKILRATKQISQKQLANLIGVTPAYLSMIENNSKKPSLSLVEKICKTLEIPLNIFFSELALAQS